MKMRNFLIMYRSDSGAGHGIKTVKLCNKSRILDRGTRLSVLDHIHGTDFYFFYVKIIFYPIDFIASSFASLNL